MNYGCVLQNTFVLYGSISALHFVICHLFYSVKNVSYFCSISQSIILNLLNKQNQFDER